LDGMKRTAAPRCVQAILALVVVAGAVPAAAAPTNRAVPQPPSEHVVDGVTVATRTPVTHLAADASHVAFVVSSRAADCDHVVASPPAAKSLRRLSSPAPVACPVGGTRDYEFYDLAFAGSRAE